MIYLHKSVFQSHGYLSSYLYNHTVTCPVITVTSTVDGFSRSLDSHCMRSGTVGAQRRLIPFCYFYCNYIFIIYFALAGANIHSTAVQLFLVKACFYYRACSIVCNAVVPMSVCLSVRLYVPPSVKRVNCDKTKAPSEKSSIMTNRKSPTSSPMSLR